jgi:hypothetical protein
MTPLTGGFQVPERFTTSPPLVHRYIRVQCQVSVEMIGGRPHVRALAIEATGPPLSPADLAKLDLTQMLDAAVQQEARKHAPPLEWASAKDPVPFSEFVASAPGQAGQQEADALAAARAARHRRRVTPTDLTRVLDTFNRKGIHGVEDEFGVAERQARRLLARARKELP